MSKKRNKKNSNPPPVQPQTQIRAKGSGGRWIAIGLLVLGAGVFLYALNSDKPAASSASQTPPAATATLQRGAGETHQYRYFESAEAAHPLPVTLPPSEFQNAGIANSYAIAKEIPEVLAQQPCLCGCDNSSDDHRSLLDCYIDGHASTCMVCMKEAVFAKQKTEAGESAAQIRDAILRHEFSTVNIGTGS